MYSYRKKLYVTLNLRVVDEYLHNDSDGPVVRIHVLPCSLRRQGVPEHMLDYHWNGTHELKRRLAHKCNYSMS